MAWLTEIFLKHIGRVIIYGIIILSIGFVLYSLFLKPTNTTNVASGGTIKNFYGSESTKFPILNFGCSNMQVEAYWKRPIGHK